MYNRHITEVPLTNKVLYKNNMQKSQKFFLNALTLHNILFFTFLCLSQATHEKCYISGDDNTVF